MDQKMYWNDLNQVESDPPVFPSTANMSCTNLAGEGSVNSSMWSSGGSSSTRHQLNLSNDDEVEVLGWTSSRAISGGQGSGTEERQLVAMDVGLGLNSDHSVTQDGNNSSSLNLLGSSSSGIGFLTENCEGGSGSSMEGQRRACKRKSFEGLPVRSTALSISSSSNSSQRNCRIRTDPPPQSSDPSFVPFSQAAPDAAPNLQPLSWSGASSSRMSLRSSANAPQRTGVSTRTRAMTSQRLNAAREERLNAAREENSSRNISRSAVPESLVFVPATDTSNNSVQNPASTGIGRMVPESRPVRPTSTAHDALSQYRRRFAEILGRSSLTPGSSGPGQGTDLSHNAGNPSNAQETTSQGPVSARVQPYARSASSDRFGDALAARIGRSLALSEQLRSAFQLLRGAEDQLEDMPFFDHSAFYERALNLRDRHREMRLDVDNMSYEELLALEERIGNVSTGLSEETVMKYLKQRKYISLSEETTLEVEPCCVCQEAYVDEEDVGRLDCGHDFHTMCIKQWLTQKNSCPICKTTGLDTEKRKKEA